MKRRVNTMTRYRVLVVAMTASTLAIQAALFAQPALAKRVALVVGNSDYENQDYFLPNPSNDATAMSEVLEDIGFEVIQAIDQDYRGMRRALQRFGRELNNADAGLFFYAGHGMEFQGTNYLVPTDAELQAESDVYVSLMSLNDILRTMESAVATRLIILDACRDNPLARTLQRSMPASRSSSVNSGLAKVDAAVGTLIAYSTAPGDVAADGVGKHSPFTGALLEHLPTPGLDAREIFTRVRRDVVTESERQQVPWESSSLLGNFYFVEEEPEPEPEPEIVASIAPAAAPTVNPALQPAPPGGGFDSGLLELRAWELAQTLQSRPAFEAYQSGFCPGGRFCAFADLMLQSLDAEEQAQIQQQATAVPVQASRGEPVSTDQLDETEQAAADAEAFSDAVDNELKVQVEQEAEAEQIIELAALAETLPEAEALPELTVPEVIPSPMEAETSSSDDSKEDAETKPIAALPTPKTIEADLQLSRDMWRELQDRLTKLGYDTAGVDGLPGARTRTAVLAWQSATEFEGTGFFDAETLDALLTASLPEPEPVAEIITAEPEVEPQAEEALEQLAATEGNEEPKAIVDEAAASETEEAAEENTNLAALPIVTAAPVETLSEEPEPEPEVPVSNPDDEVAAPVVISTITEGPQDAAGQLRLGMAYLTGQGANQDEARAVQWLTFSAEQGDVTAQSVLGTLHDDGRGTPEDDAKAVRWYKAAAEQGDLAAQFNLGIMYANGNGTARDESEAFRWFMEAALKDNVAAMFNIAVRYAEGRGIEQNDAEAVNWYRRAANEGDADAQLNLGVMYAEGRGVPKNDKQAVLWYGRAAEQGHPQAQFNLAIMYEAGRGVEANAQEAEYWYTEAAKPR